MRIIKQAGITCLAALGALFLQSTTLLAEGDAEGFKPNGSPFVKVFFNYHYSLLDNGNASGFELNRAYLGYSYKLSEQFSMKMNLDVGQSKVEVNDSTTSTSSLNYTAYLKNACMEYKGERFSISAGMIGLQNFKVQEAFWGHRYIFKSFQDEQKIAPSADLGVLLAYKPSSVLSADLTVRNGEGYKKVQMDNVYNVGLGLTLTPADGLVIRGYYDFSEDDVTRSVITGFIGYRAGKLMAGAEYNHVLNEKYRDGHNLDGVSGYFSYSLGEKFEVFGRVDRLASNTVSDELSPWNQGKDGSAYLAGVQFTPVKGLKSALNYRLFDAAEEGKPFTSQIFLNFEFAFK